jgi:hypothetical protein
MGVKYTPDMIQPYGLVPYAVYGGIVYSFKCPAATGDKVFDAALIDEIFIRAMLKLESEQCESK